MCNIFLGTIKNTEDVAHRQKYKEEEEDTSKVFDVSMD